jgi:predicted SAM-dependent methyltransferase
VQVGVDWCNARIARPHSNFKFVHADVYNQQYIPEGLLDAASYSFPYENDRFSLVFATSVLTHLLPDAACQYLKETSRVLKLGGRSVVTFFIINDESRRYMMSSGLCFQPTERGYWTTQPDYPEAAIAFEEEKVLTMYEKAGLEIQTPIRYGNWSGRDGLVGGQDHVLAIKR